MKKKSPENWSCGNSRNLHISEWKTTNTTAVINQTISQIFYRLSPELKRHDLGIHVEVETDWKG
jgi:hypothetical protein